jgi:fatty acid desaturase
MNASVPVVEWRTLSLIALCYLGLGLSTTLIADFSIGLAFVLTTLLITLHSSLQHEALHGHPTRHRWLNELLIFPAVGLIVPYGRFRDTHLAHHHDEILTDPYDDPETNYLDPKVWVALPYWLQLVLRVNNTLLGRILLGPMISTISFIRSDIRAAIGGQYKIALCWSLHLIGIVPVLWWVATIGSMPLWVYVAASYLGFGILKIRTFLEHRAFEAAQGRSVVIEDRGLLAFLFLNNNFHAVHHAHPGAPWYRLPGLYEKDRDGYLDRNNGYFYPSYLTVLGRYFLHAKDPVPHPLRPLGQAALKDNARPLRQ